jgi:MYXO-CTERM domain-containing protein
MRGLYMFALGGACTLLMQSCGGDHVPGDVGRGEQALAYPGPWVIPPGTLALGDTQTVMYEGAGPWTGEEACAGGLEPGSAILGDYLAAIFPQIMHVGGYACRPVNGSTVTMSVHATGRALDLMLPTIGDDAEADNDLGDPVGEFLIENAETLGVQFIIWDRWDWMAARPAGEKGKAYTGAHPHNDHVHVELSAMAAMQTADWFSDVVTPPAIDGCLPLGPDGGVIDELDPCFQAFGAWDYWRSVGDAGYGGSLLWTNAWEHDVPANWARWHIALEAAGEYEVEVFLTSPFSVYPDTRYAVRHAGEETTRHLDQSAAEGWVSLGRYTFGEGDDQWIAVYDNVEGSVEADQHIAVDALRLVRAVTSTSDAGVPLDPPLVDASTGLDGGADEGSSMKRRRHRRGCATSGSPSELGLSALLVALLALRSRRRSTG